MRKYVVDTGVAIAWFMPSEHSAAALALLHGKRQAIAPDLLIVEAANVLWKQSVFASLPVEQARGLMNAVLGASIEWYPAVDLVRNALDIGLRTEASVYDCIFAALAMEQECVLVTTDKKFVRRMSKTPLARQIQWIGGKLDPA